MKKERKEMEWLKKARFEPEQMEGMRFETDHRREEPGSRLVRTQARPKTSSMRGKSRSPKSSTA